MPAMHYDARPPRHARLFAHPMPSAPPRPGATAEEQALGEQAARVLRRFRIVFNAVRTHFHQVERQAGVGGAQLWALSLVEAHPGLSIGELAQAMDIHQSTASNLVRGLVERDLVASARGDQDRRTTALTLRPAGRKVLQQAPGPFSGVLPNALAGLDARTLARLDRDLAQLIEVLGADEQGAGEPLGQ